MRVLLLIVCFSAIIAGCGPTSRYEVSGDHVVFNTRRGPNFVSEADVTTFRPIGGLFAKDARHVFFGEEVVEGADPLSFSVIDAMTGRDAKSIYRASDRCDECDFESFQRVGDDWYVDKNAVYSALNNGWKRTERANSGSLTVINDWFAKDRSNVYLSGYRMPVPTQHHLNSLPVAFAKSVGRTRTAVIGTIKRYLVTANPTMVAISLGLCRKRRLARPGSGRLR